jgi:hypothetical protein
MSVDRVLDQFAPISEAEGDWERVLADAQREPTRHVRALGLGVPVLAAALVAIVALAWPFQSEPPTVLARALAAIGDGPVIHVVTRGEWGGTQIDLRSGEVRPQHAETEVWYDPDRGLHYVSRLGDRVVADHVEAPGPAADRGAEQYIALADRYRNALRAGRARVVAKGRVEGRPVYWIRIRGQWFPDVGDGKNHLLAEEVAVDRDTYAPVYTRSTLDGRPAPGGGSLLLELERLAAGEGDFSADPSSDPRGVYGGAELTENLTPRKLARVLGGRAVWLGDSFAGLPLVQARQITFKQRRRSSDPWQTTRGVSVFYGSLHPRRGGIRLRDDSRPFVQLLQATEASPRWPSWRGGISGLREGLLLVEATGTGFLRHNGVYVSISSRSARRVLAAAVAVRSVGAPAPPRTSLDLERLAKALEERRGHTVRTEGGAPVEPRAIVKRGKRVLQEGEIRGVTLRIYPPGVAVVDTRRMERSLQSSLPETLSWHCFRVLRRDSYPQSGGSGPIPRSGVKTAVVFASPSRRNRRRAPVPLRPPYDGCELGTGYGRNWLPRFDWHGPLEITLTERGGRYFEERAAARELAHFVRNGARRQARIRMKAGADAPSAERLSDPGRPYISVTSTGDRFRASLTAPTGRGFYIEIVRGRIGPKNVGLPLAFVR